MRNGWQSSSLGDVLAVIKNGLNCKQDKSGHGQRISRIESISLGTFDLSRVGYAAISSLERSKFKLVKGDILFSHINSSIHVGKTAIFDVDEEVYHGVNLLLMRPTPAVAGAYLELYLKYLFGQGYWLSVCKQSVNQASVNQQDISRVPITFPVDHGEQRRIVAILDEAFESIATARANAEQHLQNAREVFEATLDATFTRQGGDWERAKLQDICTLYNGRAYNKDELLAAGKYPVLRVGNFFTNRHWYYSDLELEANKYCDTGDLLYAWSASFGPRVWDGGKVIFHYHIWKVVPRVDRVEKDFLKHLLEWDTEKIKAAQGVGTTMMHVGKGSMDARVVPVPPLHIQRLIVARLDALEQEVQQLADLQRRKIAALDELKKALLHRAFSGALTATAADQQVAEVA